MALPARAAALRGDDLQHAVGWYWAVCAYQDPEITSVSIEDRDGGSFDDVVVRRVSTAHRLLQVKNSNFGGTLIDDKWLLATSSSSERARSPLQHFFDTWKAWRDSGEPFDLELLSTRGFDPAHQILGEHRDLLTHQVDVQRILDASGASRLGKARLLWQEHLNISAFELVAFLSAVRFRYAGNENDWDEKSALRMQLNGLRHDREALTMGRALVRNWVKLGSGEQSRDEIRAQIHESRLQATDAVLHLVVHGIDRERGPAPATVEIDLLDLYVGDDPQRRHRLVDDAAWEEVRVRVRAAVEMLESLGPRTVRVVGKMRLPVWFLLGAELAATRGWVLETERSGVAWSTISPPASDREHVVPQSNAGSLSSGSRLAVAVSLTHPVGDDARYFLRAAGWQDIPILELDPPAGTEVGHYSVGTANWLVDWARAARAAIRQAVTASGAIEVHLFIAAPAQAALFLGHFWNMLPATVVYEFDPATSSYFSTVRV
jgi:hypothetical protein